VGFFSFNPLNHQVIHGIFELLMVGGAEVKKIIFFLVPLLFCIGCAAKVPLAPSTLDLAAKEFPFSPGKANIYIFRAESGFGAAILFQIFLDGSLKGGIAEGTYLFLKTTAGEHTISTFSNENQDSVTLKIEEGKNYFLEVEAKWGVMTARVRIKQVDEKSGREAVIACKRAEGMKLSP